MASPTRSKWKTYLGNLAALTAGYEKNSADDFHRPIVLHVLGLKMLVKCPLTEGPCRSNLQCTLCFDGDPAIQGPWWQVQLILPSSRRHRGMGLLSRCTVEHYVFSHQKQPNGLLVWVISWIGTGI